jgi:hypothetical protein
MVERAPEPETDAVRGYVVALNNEQASANGYAELIRRLGERAYNRPRSLRNERRWRRFRPGSPRGGKVTRGLY